MDNNIQLYGASGHAKVVIDILNRNNQIIDTILDDNPQTKEIAGFIVINTKNFDFNFLKNTIISIGNNKIRKILASKLKTNFSTAFHPKAIISKNVSIGEGTVIMAGVVINPDVTIGNHCIINSSAILEHDCIIENFVHISPGVAIAGGVTVGEGSHVGINATIIQNIKIGKWVTIGAGAVVLKNIPDFAVAVGNPAKIIKYNSINE